MPRLSRELLPLEPKADSVLFSSPLPGGKGQLVGVVAFHSYGQDSVEKLCGAGFLCNDWDVLPTGLDLEAPCAPGATKHFKNAEAAFQALACWKHADSFAKLSAQEARERRQSLGEQLQDIEQEGTEWGGFGSEWRAMLAVLEAKFRPERFAAAGLMETGEAFLLQHQLTTGLDTIWSNNSDGEGTNWLGLQLMLVRDRLSGQGEWTAFLARIFNLETGDTRNEDGAQQWQKVVRDATRSLQTALGTQPAAGAEGGILRRSSSSSSLHRSSFSLGSSDEEQGGSAMSGALRAASNSSATDRTEADPEPMALALAERQPEQREQRRSTHERRGTRERSVLSIITEETSIAQSSARVTLHEAPAALARRSSALSVMTNSELMEEPGTLRKREAPGYRSEGTTSWRSSSSGSKLDLRMSMSSEASASATVFPLEVVNVNRSGIVPCLLFACSWVASATAVLAAILWTYVFGEVQKQAEVATEVAVAHVRLQAAEALAPAVAAVKGVATALSGGTLASAWDYAGLLRLLAPHFEARPAMREVELAGPPENFNGSVHVTPAYGGGIELRTDRPDCAQVEGRRGCSLKVLGANGSDWYAHAWGIGNEWYEVAPASFWEGPAFARTNPHEVICDELCWRPTYALVSRVAGGPTPPADTTTTTNTTTTTYVPFNVSAAVPVPTPAAPSVTPSASSTAPAAPPAPVAPPVLVRAAMDTAVLQDVARMAEKLSRGQAFLCTADGQLLAASDMAETLLVESSTGDVRAAYVWELRQPWAPAADQTFVQKARPANNFASDGFSVSAWPLPSLAEHGTGAELRVVLAVPADVFLDAVLGPLVPWALATAIAPVAALALFTLLAGLWKCSSLAASRRKPPATVGQA